MKVIDLLNKIAKGEDVPKKIKHWKEEYLLNIYEGFITCESKGGNCLDLIQCLNDTVEIIEEQEYINIQDIKELPEYIHIGDGGADTDVKDEVNITINEIIRAVKYLEKTKEDK